MPSMPPEASHGAVGAEAEIIDGAGLAGASRIDVGLDGFQFLAVGDDQILMMPS